VLTKQGCPSCFAAASPVSLQTIKHHVKKPWRWHDGEQDYYFCASQGCDTVYFTLQGTVILQNELRTLVGVKSTADDALICYCFDVSRADATNPEAKAYVTAQTKTKQCACKTRNPSGRCCLKDFPNS
jgi:hypothetical protein